MAFELLLRNWSMSCRNVAEIRFRHDRSGNEQRNAPNSIFFGERMSDALPMSSAVIRTGDEDVFLCLPRNQLIDSTYLDYVASYTKPTFI